MALELQRITVVGATGPTGRTLVSELCRREHPVRAVSRSIDSLNACFPGGEIEKRSGDALDFGSLQTALEGSDLVIDCIGLPGDRMADHPVTARNIARWTATTGARCLQVSSYWSFMPIGRLPVTEAHPRQGGPAWARLRRETEDILRDRGGAIVHLPDFFGPHVHTSTLQNAVREAVAGKTVNWIGAGDIERDYIFVPDAMRIVADLLIRPEAYGDDWIIPGTGPLSGNHLAELLGGLLGHDIRLRAAPLWLLRIIGLFNSELRGFLQVAPDYVKPIAYDGAKLERLLGKSRRTPYEEALRTTIRSLPGTKA